MTLMIPTVGFVCCLLNSNKTSRPARSNTGIRPKLVDPGNVDGFDSRRLGVVDGVGVSFRVVGVVLGMRVGSKGDNAGVVGVGALLRSSKIPPLFVVLGVKVGVVESNSKMFPP